MFDCVEIRCKGTTIFRDVQEKLRITIVRLLLGFELLVKLGDDETTEGSVTLLVGLGVLELTLE